MLISPAAGIQIISVTDHGGTSGNLSWGIYGYYVICISMQVAQKPLILRWYLLQV